MRTDTTFVFNDGQWVRFHNHTVRTKGLWYRRYEVTDNGALVSTISSRWVREVRHRPVEDRGEASA